MKSQHLVLLVLLCLAAPLRPQSVPGDALEYSAASVVNAATFRSGLLAPNTIATVFGKNLARSTRALTTADLGEGNLPTRLGGVSVFVNNFAAGLYYSSGRQINFLVPGNLLPGPAEVYVVRDALRGPSVRVELANSSPGLFQLDERHIIATHVDGSLITPENPAPRGGVIILYGTGFGPTDISPLSDYLRIPIRAKQIVDFSRLEVIIRNEILPLRNVLYAGVAPGFAGLYQINLLLPDLFVGEAEIRIGLGDSFSPAGLIVPIR